MAEPAVTEPQQSPEGRLYAAGFTRQLEWWVLPDGSGVLNLADAIAALDSGAVAPDTITVPDGGVRALPDELVNRICPPPVTEPPAWLLAQAEVIARVSVERLKPLIRREVRRRCETTGPSRERHLP